jgi:hypothetical protein
VYLNRTLAAILLLALGALTALALPEPVANVWFWLRTMITTAWSATS